MESGLHLFVTFQSEITYYLIMKAPKSIECLLNYGDDKPSQMTTILFAVLDRLTVDKKLQKS